METNFAQVQILNPAISSGKYELINKLAPVVKNVYKYCVNADIGQPMQIRTGGCVLSCGYNYPCYPLQVSTRKQHLAKKSTYVQCQICFWRKVCYKESNI